MEGGTYATKQPLDGSLQGSIANDFAVFSPPG